MFKDLFGNLLNWKNKTFGKHIAFVNIGHVALQQKTICLFQDQAIKNNIVLPKKIAIVSFEVGKGVYQRFISTDSQLNDSKLVSKNLSNADFINWSFLIGNKLGENFLAQYDLVLWDLPELSMIHNNSENMKEYFNLFSTMIIVSNSQALVSNQEQIVQIKTFFKNHGFKLPKLINDSSEEKTKKDRRSSLMFWN